jgi:hypothetical protein
VAEQPGPQRRELIPRGAGQQAFDVLGLASGTLRRRDEGPGAGLLRQHGVATADVDRVWEAIALHSSIGIAGRRGLLTYLTHKGVFTDAGQFTDLPEDLRQPVFTAYPRPAGDTYIRDAIVAHARRSPAAAPPYSIAAELLRQERTR